MASIQRRGKKWRAQVRVGSVYRSETFNTKGAADAWASKTEDAIRVGDLAGHEIAGMKLAAAVAEYERDRRAHKPIAPTIRGNLRRWEESTGERPLGALVANDVVEHAKARTCGPATMLLELSALRGLLVWAKAKGLNLARDPIAEAMPALRQLRRVAKSKERDRRPTADEITKLRAAFTGRRLPMGDLMDFAIATAMRTSEILSIRWADLDEVKRLVMIRDRKDPQDKEGNDQWVPLLGDAMAIVARQPRTAAEIFPYHEDSTGRAWRETCKRLKIVDLHFHDLRHEGTSRLFEQGYQIHEVAIVTGHRDWKSLKRYTNLRPESLHRTAPE